MKKSIGILGGMGPLATADLLRKIVLLTKAEKDGDHIRIYIDDNPNIPDRTAAILSGGESPLPQMRDSLGKLALCGADCIIMPCNTAHYFLPQLQSETEIPFISMLASTAEACAQRYAGKCAAVLATKGTLATGLYARALEAEGAAYLIPDAAEQDMLMHIIYDVVKASKPLAPETEISSFVLPLGSTINMDGTAIYQAVCAVFIACCYGIDLTIGDMAMIVVTATLASIGTAGTPGAGMIMLAMVLTQVGLPVEGIAIIAGVDKLFDMGRTTLNITGDATCALFISRIEREKKAKAAAK